MRKNFLLLIIIAVIFSFLISCSSPPGAPPSILTRGKGTDPGTDPGPTPANKTFWAQDFTDNTFYEITAQRLAANTRCDVWVEVGSGVTQEQAQEVANKYINTIYPGMMDVFSWTASISGYGVRNTMQYADLIGNGDGRLTLLLLDIKDGYVKDVNDSYTAGYFSALNFYNSETVNNLDPAYKTNECDMIYVDINPGLSTPEFKITTYRTIAHEMQHLMNFVTSNIFSSNNVRFYTMDLWIDEGLSSAAEWIYDGTHSDHRIKWYNADPVGTIAAFGNNFYVWGNYIDDYPEAILDDYATVYLFFQYLRLQKNSSDIYYNIITSRDYNYRAVTEHYNKSWNVLLGEWLAANYINNNSGVYGYKGDSAFASLKKHHVNYDKTTYPLFPGEGVYSYVSGSPYTVPQNSVFINYLGMGVTGTTSYIPAGRALLTYNVNTNTNGNYSNGTITGEKPPLNIQRSSVMGSSSSGSSSSQVLTEPTPIGAGDLLRRNGHDADIFRAIQ